MTARGRIVPGPRLAPAAALGLPLALGGDPGLAAALAWDALVLIGAGIEGRAARDRAPAIERATEPRLVVGARNTITVRVHNASDRAVRIRVRDTLPEGWSAEPAELAVELAPWARRDLAYDVVPPRRGVARLGDLHVRVEGPLGLGAAIVELEAAADVRVYPDVRGPRRYELAARLRALRSQGFRAVRQIGGGGELEQLREYAVGDPFRDLEWKSSAKRQRPITRVMQQERSQSVVIAIDAGRMMAATVEAGGGPGARAPLTKLDHAIDGALMLAHVALRHGDRVGLVVIGDEVRTFVPPARGAAQYRRILEALFAVEPELVHVDFRRLAEFARLRLPRRSLLVLWTDLLEEAHARPLAEHARVLRSRHLPLCVSLRDPACEALATREVARAPDAYQRAAAADLLAERAALRAHLERSGVSVVEAAPGQLAVAAVNRYLEIKARSAL